MEKAISIRIDAEMDGNKIKYILRDRFKISASMLKKLKREADGILLNGAHATVVEKVCEGDVLEINIKGEESEHIVPVDIPLDILLEDEDILVVNKPGTMPVHPSRWHGDDTLANGVMYHIGSRDKIHIITRLDKETSGIVLIAKNPWSAALLSEQMKCGKIKKEYFAIVNGVPEPAKETISAPIRRKEEDEMLRCVADDGKEAVTIYEVTEKTEDLALVKLNPVTGRTHQLRVHMSYIGNPIYGDIMYGALQENERTRLHCRKISFYHPKTEEEIVIDAPIPNDFNNLVTCKLY